MTTEQKPGTDMVFATASLKDRMDWSRAIAGAGNLVPAGFRDGPNANPAKILLAVEYGAMLGLHPMAALAGIHVIEGRPTLSAALMSSLVHKAGHKLRVASTGSVTGEGAKMAGDFTVTATLIRSDDNQHPFVCTWTIDRAKRAGLWGKGNWTRYPENQMTWRAISEVTKLGAPEVLSGVWHTPDELGAAVDEDGDVIDAEVVEQDHDGPQVQAMARDTIPNQKPSRVRKTEARLRDPGATGPAETVPPSGLPRQSRPRTDPVAGTADEATRPHVDVFRQWAEAIRHIRNLDDLSAANADAANRHVLDISDGTRTIEDVLLAKRDELRQTTAGEPEPHIMLDGADVEYPDSEDVPF